MTTDATSDIRDAFEVGCERARLQARLESDGDRLRPVFEGQENAEPPLIEQHFFAELNARLEGRMSFDGPGFPISVDDPAPLVESIHYACDRIRSLLIEHNSYLSGGLTWPWNAGDRVFRDRGLAIYRYEKLAPVDVVDEDGAIRVHHHPHEAEETSSGFYAPTLLDGDLDISVRYEMTQWEPGPVVACLALFLQNEASTIRHYAQRITSGGGGSRDAVQGVHRGQPSERIAHAGHHGHLRLVRRGRAVEAFHRGNTSEEWVSLGRDEESSDEPFLFGAKAWMERETGHLDVRFEDLVIHARPATRQLPPFEYRTDPRKTAAREQARALVEMVQARNPEKAEARSAFEISKLASRMGLALMASAWAAAYMIGQAVGAEAGRAGGLILVLSHMGLVPVMLFAWVVLKNKRDWPRSFVVLLAFWVVFFATLGRAEMATWF